MAEFERKSATIRAVSLHPSLPGTSNWTALRFIHRSVRTLIGLLPTYSTTPDLTKMGAT